MRTVIFDEFGGPEVLHVTEVEAPTAGPGQIRIAVRMVGVNGFDWKVRSGHAPFPVTLPYVPGIEAAGLVDQVGEGVEGMAIGDAAFGLARRALAEHAILTVFAAKPASMSWEEAASLPVSAEAAVRTLDLLGLKAGQTLVIGSAAGSVGTIAVQLAVAAGATVIGTASEANYEYLRSLGAIPVTYGEGLVERVRAVAPNGVDLALDCGGHGALPDLITLTGSPDDVITIADPDAERLGVRFSSGGGDSHPEAISIVARLFDEGTISVRTGPVFGFDDVAGAHVVSEGGHTPGKPLIVLE